MSQTTDPTTAGCIVALKRCQAIMNALTPEQYCFRSPGHSSIGEHVRHTIDHFHCFLRGIRCNEINYDERDRIAALETDPAEASRAMQKLVEELSALDRVQDDTISVVQTAAPGCAPVRSTSTISRELAFLSGHAIHHIALMRLIAHQAGAEPLEEIDLAFSTEKHRNAVVDEP